jgi:phage terminase large subunit-like protein
MELGTDEVFIRLVEQSSLIHMRGRVSLLRLLQRTVPLGISRKQIRFNVPPHALHQTLLQRPDRLETKGLFAHVNRSCVESGTRATSVSALVH